MGVCYAPSCAPLGSKRENRVGEATPPAQRGRTRDSTDAFEQNFPQRPVAEGQSAPGSHDSMFAVAAAAAFDLGLVPPPPAPRAGSRVA